MAQKVFVKGYKGYREAIVKVVAESRLFVYFGGTKDESGVSWCKDCVVAEPHLKAALNKFTTKRDLFLDVDVGDRPFWKDMNNPFRTDKDLYLRTIPTIIWWGSGKRLDGRRLVDDVIMEEFFADS